MQFVSVPDLDCSLALPPGNIRRVVNPCASRGRAIPLPSASHMSRLGSLYPLQDQSSPIKVPSVFTESGWCSRRLTLPELFQLWDSPSTLFRRLAIKHRKWLWEWKSNPPRVL